MTQTPTNYGGVPGAPTTTYIENPPPGLTHVPGGYNPSGAQAPNLTQQTGTIDGQVYNSPVAYNPAANGGPSQNGYIDFGSTYNPISNPNDFFYYSDYSQAEQAADPTNAPIVYGSGPTNSLAGTPGNGDPTINGVDYTSGASYENQATQGIGTPVPPAIGIPENPTPSNSVIPYNQYTEPGYIPPAYNAAVPTGTQSYGSQGQTISAPGNTDTTNGPGYAQTFYYGDNGSLGSISGTSTSDTPGTYSTFYQNEPGSLTGGTNPNTLGAFSGQSYASPADTSSNYFSYGSNYSQIQANNLSAAVSGGGVNEATGGINGYNPLGLDQTDQTTLSGTDSALGYYGQLNPITGQTQANTNQANPALQALNASRSLN